MVKTTAEKIKYLVLFSIGLVLSGCANQLPPGGGEIDKIPPTIVETYPENGTTSFMMSTLSLHFLNTLTSGQ